MTQQEIAAKEIGENLYGALHQLRQARRLINESDHAIASGNTELAIRETEQAIKMMKQDYANYARCVDGCGHRRIDHHVSMKTLEGYCNISGCACTKFDGGEK